MEIKIKSSISYIMILVFFAILLNNCFYGFGWTDEALYLSILNSNFQGNEFFFDIWEPTQFYSLFLIPLYSLILKFQNNNNQIFFTWVTLAEPKNGLNCGDVLRASIATTWLETVSVNAATYKRDHKNILDWVTEDASSSNASKFP